MKVSILMATHNRKDMIGQAIQSVLDQTHTDWELFISDDVPDSTTKEVIPDDPRIRYINEGEADYYTINRNRGLKYATGDLIATLDDDNWWDSTFLERHVLIHATKDVAISYCGHIQHLPQLDRLVPIRVYKGETETLNGYVDASECVYKRKVFGEGFTEELDHPSYCSDMKKIDEVLEKYPHMKVVCIPEYLLHYRLHDDGMTVKKLQARKRGEFFAEQRWEI